jgi:hypothetical protein
MRESFGKTAELPQLPAESCSRAATPLVPMREHWTSAKAASRGGNRPVRRSFAATQQSVLDATPSPLNYDSSATTTKIALPI